MPIEDRKCPECGHQLETAEGKVGWDETGQKHPWVGTCAQCNQETGIDHTYSVGARDDLIGVTALPDDDLA